MGFILNDAAAVRAKHQQLQEAGVATRDDATVGGPNLYFVCLGPDSIPIEVRAPLGPTN